MNIRQSFSQSKVGKNKPIIIVDKWNYTWNVVINIVDTGQQFEFDIRKLEVKYASRRFGEDKEGLEKDLYIRGLRGYCRTGGDMIVAMGRKTCRLS